MARNIVRIGSFKPMTIMLAIVTLASFAIACSSTPEPEAVVEVTVHTEEVPIPTEATITVEPSPSPTMTPRPTPTATPDAMTRALLPAAGKLCEDTHTVLPEHKWALSPEPDAVAVINVEYEDQGWQLSDILAPPGSPEDIHTLVCIEQTRIKEGMYVGTVGGTAYRPQWDVWLITWPEGELLGGVTFLGGDPPSTVTTSGPHYGESPQDDVAVWLDRVVGKPLFRAQEPAAGVRYSADAETLLVNLWEKVVAIETGSGKEVNRIEFPGEYVFRTAFSSDLSLAAASVCTQREERECTDWEVQVRDTISGELLHTFGEHTSIVRVLAFSPDGRFLATASSQTVDGTTREEIILWDLSTGRGRPFIFGEVGHVYGMVFSPDGSRLITDINESIGVWDTQSGELVARVPLAGGDWYKMALSPDGRTLAVGYCWDIEGPRCGKAEILLRDLEEEESMALVTPQGHGLDIDALSFSADGTKLALGTCTDFATAFTQDQTPVEYCAASQIVLWDMAAFERIGVVGNYMGRIAGLDFAPDGTLLASAGYNGIVQVWPIQ